MEIQKLTAESRDSRGKGPASRLRRSGKIPAVAYGGGLQATPVAVSPKALSTILLSEFGRNSVIELQLDGKAPITVMVREYSYHPVTRELVHCDFMQVSMETPVEVSVPCECVGKSKGVVLGGRLQQIFRHLPIRCLPDKIPPLIQIDVSELDMEDTVKAGQIALPEGVEIRLPAEQTVAAVHAEKVVAEGEGAGEGAEGEEGAAAAPAEGAAADDKAKEK